ncbi:HAD-IA family hydrolase [Phyllobacterium zundukense]|uniref:HAD-IA family hydrolase n=1 Tax=Phyllobacterium zundukense TaxID=1867719 RepID=A0ACD4CVQ0_9HYPH|nr:HAD-IA family hydrolase [Phyllobacterium zundukense]UXN57666.1 HAD-IA family hydrolase [Phyllobacterium zundukense]
MPFELLICDCDGVLVDSEVLACRVDAEELAGRGFDSYPLEKILTRFVGVSQGDMIKAIEAETGKTIGADFILSVTNRVQEALKNDLLPLPEVGKILGELKIKKCVASSSAPKKLDLALDVTGLTNHFAPHVYSAVLVKHGKPAPDLFLYAARDMQVPPDRCCVIEDSPAGVAAGIAAGMSVIGFTGGAHCLNGHGERLLALGAHAVAQRWSEIPNLLSMLASSAVAPQACGTF